MPRSVRLHAAALLAALTAAILVQAQSAGTRPGTTSRETPATRRLDELVRAINSGDSATIARFVIDRGGPAGGGYSTVEGLTRFAEAPKSGKLVGKHYVDVLTTAKPELESDDYGYGFGVADGGRNFGHSGGFPGINSELVVFRDDGDTIAVMSNYSMGAQPVVERARALLMAGRTATAAR